jgi:flagellin-specific chaperone FliS
VADLVRMDPGADPERLALVLFEEAVRSGIRARAALERGDLRSGHELIRQTRKIVLELEGSLDGDSEPVSGHLAAIYAHLLRRLEAAADDPYVLDEAVRDLEELAGTWSCYVVALDGAGGPR